MHSTDEPELYAVCFLDLLGFKGLVRRFKSNLGTVRAIEGVFGSAFRRLDQFRTREPVNKYALANKIVAQHTKYRMISDSTIFTLPVSGLPKLDQELDDLENRLLCVESFLIGISLFWLWVGGKMGYFHRGGVTIGRHYENVLNEPGNVFIFSEALVDAASLQASGDPMRIVLGEGVYEYFSTLSSQGKLSDSLDGLVFIDEDNKRCLDTYSVLQEDERTKQILADLAKGIRLQREQNAAHDDIIKKYRWLGVYHNRHVRRLIKDTPNSFLVPED